MGAWASRPRPLRSPGIIGDRFIAPKERTNVPVPMTLGVMKDIEQDSIRNFKFQPNKGCIVIEEPDEDDYHFHIK